MIDGKFKIITVIDDVFSNDDCKFFIDYFNDHLTEIRVNETLGTQFFPIVDFITGNPLDSLVASKLAVIFKYLGKDIRMQRAHVECRNKGVDLPWHFDTADPSVVFTSILYLNDDYSGGQTIIRPNGETSDKYDLTVSPRVGRMVFFDGTHHFHAVNEVKEGQRYTIPTWYRRLPGDFPEKHKWWENV